MLNDSLFTRHLDLSPLKGRRRGLVACPFHQDSTPSLSVDLDALVFNCHGCGQQGGYKRFAVLVGETPITAEINTRPEPEETPWLVAMRTVRRQGWSRPGVLELYAVADWIRLTRRDVDRVRRDPSSSWETLAAAAHLETLAHTAEAELDAIYAEGRIG